MASKKEKSKVKAEKPVATAGPVNGTEGTANPPQKKKKNDPLRPQPAWLFPPDEENPILNPKGKTPEQIQKEIDERLAAIRFLEHKALAAPVKTAPPSELLQLIGAFLASYGFVSSGRIFSLERNARKKLDGWNDAIGEKKLGKDMPDLVKIYKDWRADWAGESDADDTSSSGESSDEDVNMKDTKDSSEDSSDSDSSDSDKEPAKSTAGPKTNGVKVKTKLSDAAPKKAAQVAKEDSSSSSSSDSDSSSDEEEPSKKTTTVAKTAKKVVDSSSDSESSSSSESDSESESGASETTKKNTTVLPTAGSDSSVTLKGTSPDKALSPSVSSSSSDSSESSSDSSSDSDSDSEAKAAPATKTSSKRKASSPAVDIAAATDDTTPQAIKKTKITNEPFSRIPKDQAVDPRLASNKYVSYDYAESAHRDLIVTKGKGFTKEKNKKKRGSYRGGKIDTMGGKAVKFDD